MNCTTSPTPYRWLISLLMTLNSSLSVPAENGYYSYMFDNSVDSGNYKNAECPVDLVGSCFQSVFGLSDRSPDWQTCEKFDYFESCFNFPCGNDEFGRIASEEYLAKFGKLMPSEVFPHVRRELAQRCIGQSSTSNNPDPHSATAPPDELFGAADPSNSGGPPTPEECSRHSSCWTRLTPHERLEDDSFRLEIDGQYQQYKLGLITDISGCRKVRLTLNRWVYFRNQRCGPINAACLCTQFKWKLKELSCRVYCASVSEFIKSSSVSNYRYGRNANTINTGSNRQFVGGQPHSILFCHILIFVTILNGII